MITIKNYGREYQIWFRKIQCVPRKVYASAVCVQRDNNNDNVYTAAISNFYKMFKDTTGFTEVYSEGQFIIYYLLISQKASFGV